MSVDNLSRRVDCPHRRRCGACALLTQDYGTQLETKRRWLREALGRGLEVGEEQLLATMASPRIVGYRNRCKMAVRTSRQGPAKLGYFERRSREIVDAKECGVLIPELLETTVALRRMLGTERFATRELAHIDLRCGSDPTNQHLTLVFTATSAPKIPVDAIGKTCPHVSGIGINLNPKGGSQVIKGRIEPLAGDREIWVKSAGMTLRVSPSSFFQVNLSQLRSIHQAMADFFEGCETLLDLYAGVGTHGLALRNQFNRVLCLEGVRGAVADAKATIRAARVSNVEVVAIALKRALGRIEGAAADAVVLNPSRVGAESFVLDSIGRSKARRIAYLSCDPTTLTRDLEILIGHGFELVSVQGIDMMPQTDQVEALALLVRT